MIRRAAIVPPSNLPGLDPAYLAAKEHMGTRSGRCRGGRTGEPRNSFPSSVSAGWW